MWTIKKELSLSSEALHTLCGKKTMCLGRYHYRVEKREGAILLAAPKSEELLFYNSGVPEITLLPAENTVRFTLTKSVKVFLCIFLFIAAVLQAAIFLTVEWQAICLLPAGLAAFALGLIRLLFVLSVNSLWKEFKKEGKA